MRRAPRPPRGATALTLLLLLCASGLEAQNGSSVDELNIYLLFGVGDQGSWESAFAGAFQDRVRNQASHSAKVFSEFLAWDESLPPGAADTVKAYLTHKTMLYPPDIVVAVLPAANRFLCNWGEEIFGDAERILVIPGDLPAACAEPGGTRVVPSAAATALEKTLSSVFLLLPATERLIIIGGTSETDRLYLPMAQRALAVVRPAMAPEAWIGYTPEELGAMSTALPARSVVLFTSAELDRTGMFHESTWVLEQVARVSPAPVFCFWDTAVGTGIVGGNVTSAAGYAAQAFVECMEYLGDTVDVEASALTSYQFDSRALRRFRIDEARLPAGSVVRFGDTSLWGRYRWVVVTVALVVVVLSGFSLALGLLVLKQRRTEARLRDSLSHIRSIGDNLSAGMIYQLRVAPDGTRSFTYLSDSVRKLYGVTPQEAMADARLIYERTIDDDRSAFARREAEAIARREPFSTEVRIRNPDGSIRWSSLVSTPRAGADGSTVWDGIESVVTGLKETEAANQRLREQLAEAQRLEAIGRLAGGIAHDFNNMLTVILGHTQLLQTPGGLAKGGGHLSKIRDAAQRSADLTRQLLAYARRQPVEPRVLDLNRKVEGTADMLRRIIGENITLEIRPGREVWPVKMDPSQTDQLLANLCANARDAIGGIGRITVATENRRVEGPLPGTLPVATPGEYVVLSVEDTGAGMDDATREHIFEPFFTTKAVGKGTGLGLATVLGVATQNGGFVAVRSALGAGSCFSIYLPRHRGVEETREEAVGVRSPGRGTLLIVEDEPPILELMQTMAEELGYTVIPATDPLVALEASAAHDGVIDLVVTDLIMPRMNGRQLADRLQQTRPGVRLLFISGYTADVVGDQGVFEEGIHFLNKPFTLDEFADRVAAVLAS